MGGRYTSRLRVSVRAWALTRSGSRYRSGLSSVERVTRLPFAPLHVARASLCRPPGVLREALGDLAGAGRQRGAMVDAQALDRDQRREGHVGQFGRDVVDRVGDALARVCAGDADPRAGGLS